MLEIVYVVLMIGLLWAGLALLFMWLLFPIIARWMEKAARPVPLDKQE